MFEHASKFGRDRREAADGNAKFAVVEGARPGGSVRDVKEGGVGVKRYQNVIAGRRSQIAGEVVIVGFERRQDLPAKCFGGLCSFIVEDEMPGLVLGEVRLGGLFA